MILTHLLVKVPRPGDSEGTFSVSSRVPSVTTCLSLTIER